MHIPYERVSEVARSPCVRVEEFMTDLPLADTVMEFMSWNDHGMPCTLSVMVGVVPREPRHLLAVVRVASPRGLARSNCS